MVQELFTVPEEENSSSCKKISTKTTHYSPPKELDNMEYLLSPDESVNK